jgi:hypothetical protein
LLLIFFVPFRASKAIVFSDPIPFFDVSDPILLGGLKLDGKNR